MTLSQGQANQLTTGVWLIGIGVLWYYHFWWPGIMFVAGASTILQGLVAGRGWYSFQGALWMIAIGAWALMNFHPAAMLLFIGGSMILGAFIRPPMFKKPQPTYDRDLE